MYDDLDDLDLAAMSKHKVAELLVLVDDAIIILMGKFGPETDFTDELVQTNLERVGELSALRERVALRLLEIRAKETAKK